MPEIFLKFWRISFFCQYVWWLYCRLPIFSSMCRFFSFPDFSQRTIFICCTFLPPVRPAYFEWNVVLLLFRKSYFIFGGEDRITALVVFWILFAGICLINLVSEFTIRFVSMTFGGAVIFGGWNFPLLFVRCSSFSQLVDSSLRGPASRLILMEIIE